MKKIVIFICIFFVSICFAMGERIKTWDPSINTGDVYHAKYEVVPFSIEGEDINVSHLYIYALPDEKMLVYLYYRDSFFEQFYETKLIYDFKNKSSKVIHKKKPTETGVYNGLLLENGNLLLKSGYNYVFSKNKENKNIKYFELFNSEKEEVEWIVSVNDYELLGVLDDSEAVIRYEDIHIYNTLTKKIVSLDLPPERKFYGIINNEIYLYSIDRDSGLKRNNNDGSVSYSYPYIILYKYDRTTNECKRIMRVSSITNKIVPLGIDRYIVPSGYHNIFVDLKSREYKEMNATIPSKYFLREIFWAESIDSENMLIQNVEGQLVTEGWAKKMASYASLLLYVVSEDRYVEFKTPDHSYSSVVKLSNGDCILYGSYGVAMFRRK